MTTNLNQNLKSKFLHVYYAFNRDNIYTDSVYNISSKNKYIINAEGQATIKLGIQVSRKVGTNLFPH